MADLLHYVAGALVLLGSVVVLVGLIGVYRMPDFYTRLHAASIVDTLGTMLIIVGLVLIAGLSLVSVKLILIMLFILITTPAAAHALAKSALHGKLQPQLEDKKS